ncbi:MAG TPA: MarR family transcriptional regulator [Acidimicrobiia bacterium]|nr:MarR family transcriptional regulator [Acidimicrobiia bacterium]
MTRKRSSGRGFRVSDDFAANNPGADPTTTELIINLVLTAGLVQGKLDRLLRDYKLTTGSLNAFQVIAGDPEPLSPSDVARRMTLPVTTATMTGILDTLERNGYIERRAHATDRRRVNIYITAKGRRVNRELLPVMFQNQITWTAALSKTERMKLTDDLAKLAEHLRSVE